MKIKNNYISKIGIALLLLILAGLLHGCFSAKSVIQQSNEKYPIPENNIHKDIPFYDNDAYPSVHFTYARQKEDALNLTKILNGFNDFIFRIWINSPTGKGIQDGELIEIRQTDGAWSGNFYSMKTNFISSKNEEAVVSFEKYEIEPEYLSWNEVLAYLVEEGIFEMKSLDQLEAYQQLPKDKKGYPYGSSVISFEVATDKMYRFYHYFALPKFMEIDEVRQVDTIMKFLTQEFNINALLHGPTEIIIYDLREKKE